MADEDLQADLSVLWQRAKDLHRAAMREKENCLYHDQHPNHFPDPGDAKRSYALEQQAANIVYEISKQAKAQPSYAILHRSAAWLALEAGDPLAAGRVALRGLEGSTGEVTPGDIFEELCEVFEAALKAIREKRNGNG